MMVSVLVTGMVFGWLARVQRQGREVAGLVSDLSRERVIVNSREPTLLCRVAMKVLSANDRDVEARLGGWIGPWWFSRPVGFNAGRLPEGKVPRLVERLQRLGTVHEVHYHAASLDGLRLFYIGKVPYGQLGPDGRTCTFRTFPAPGAGTDRRRWGDEPRSGDTG
jgi:hypothetical protein